MNKHFIDLQPGEVFESMIGGLNDQPQLYLKIANQKAVSLSSWHAFPWREQHTDVKVVGTLKLKENG